MVVSFFCFSFFYSFIQGTYAVVWKGGLGWLYGLVGSVATIGTMRYFEWYCVALSALIGVLTWLIICTYTATHVFCSRAQPYVHLLPHAMQPTRPLHTQTTRRK